MNIPADHKHIYDIGKSTFTISYYEKPMKINGIMRTTIHIFSSGNVFSQHTIYKRIYQFSI